MHFGYNFNTIKKLIEQTAEMLKSITHLKGKYQIPLGSLPSCSLQTMVDKLNADGSILDVAQFQSIYSVFKVLTDIYKFFAVNEDIDIAHEFPYLNSVADGLIDSRQWMSVIESVFEQDWNVKNSASPYLSEIRQHLSQLSGSVSSTIRRIINANAASGYIADNVTPVVREGRLLLPVEAMNKRNIKGIIHGESASGRTVFIEPAEVVELNNRIRELESAEQREILKILAELTNKLRVDSRLIEADFKIIAELDFINAKARYAAEIDALRPNLSASPEIEWYHAVNPILKHSLKEHHKEVVPLNITLDGNNRILVISGPNAGGKSVTLKTVGLIQYMTQCGLLPPVYSNSHFGIFHQIFIDIGDNQSIEDELSTYSSHIRNMRFLLKEANDKSLFLIDEFGSGTEPTIGGAIAEAILMELNRKGSWGIITTHYQNLKRAAEDNEGLMNGSMLYDRTNMTPLYTLSIGNPGSSFALEIARKSGLPTSIIETAKNIVGQEYVDADKYLLDINRDRKYWEQKRYDIKVKEKKLEKLISDWENSASELKEKRKILIEEARKQAREIVNEANSTIERTIREIREAEAEKQQTKLIRAQIEEFRKSLEEEYTSQIELSHPKIRNSRKKDKAKREKPHTAIQELVPGDLVKLDGEGITGEIISISGNKATVNFGLTKTVVALDRLKPSSEKKIHKIQPRSALSQQAHDDQKQRRNDFKSEIDVRGMRVDEALQAVTYFIDDAIQYNVSSAKILHGTGTGALRQAIRQHLSTYGTTLYYHDEDVRFGGAGITVIKFK